MRNSLQPVLTCRDHWSHGETVEPFRTMRQVKMPAAEIDISVDLVAALVEAQHPDLAGPLRLGRV